MKSDSGVDDFSPTTDIASLENCAIVVDLSDDDTRLSRITLAFAMSCLASSTNRSFSSLSRARAVLLLLLLRGLR